MEENKKVIAHYFGYSNYKTFAEDEQIKKSMGTLSKSIVNIINELERIQKEFEAVDHECSRLEKKENELEKENKKYRLEIIPKLDGEIQAYKQRIDELKAIALNSEKTVYMSLTKKQYKEYLNLKYKKCLHCGNDTPLYCEKCYQELISKNAELQLENEELRKEVNEENKRCMLLAIEKQDLIENSIPKQVIRDKIEEVNKEYKKYTEKWEKSGMNKEHPFYKYIVRLEAQIEILEELLGE